MTVYKAIRLQAEAAAVIACHLVAGEAVPPEVTGGKVVNNGKKDVPSVLLVPISVTKENVKDTIVADELLDQGADFARRATRALARPSASSEPPQPAASPSSSDANPCRDPPPRAPRYHQALRSGPGALRGGRRSLCRHRSSRWWATTGLGRAPSSRPSRGFFPPTRARCASPGSLSSSVARGKPRSWESLRCIKTSPSATTWMWWPTSSWVGKRQVHLEERSTKRRWSRRPWLS